MFTGGGKAEARNPQFVTSGVVPLEAYAVRHPSTAFGGRLGLARRPAYEAAFGPDAEVAVEFVHDMAW